MKFHLLAMILFTASACFAADKWAIGVTPGDSMRGYIGISREGFDSLSEAIANFHTKAPGVQISHIFIGLVLDHDARAQNEILKFLHGHYPNELSEAMKTAGNMHNPRVMPLRKPFEEAVMATSFIKNVQADLAKIGYTISRVEIEKFVFIKQSHSFSAGIRLITKQNSETSNPATLRPFATFYHVSCQLAPAGANHTTMEWHLTFVVQHGVLDITQSKSAISIHRVLFS
jgi:hypothetical protein